VLAKPLRTYTHLCSTVDGPSLPQYNCVAIATDQSGYQPVTVDGFWQLQSTGVASVTDQSGYQPVIVDGLWLPQSSCHASATDQSGEQPVTVDGPWLLQSTSVVSPETSRSLSTVLGCCSPPVSQALPTSLDTGVASATDQCGYQPVIVHCPWLPQSTCVTSATD